MPITGSMLNIFHRRQARPRHETRAAPVPAPALARRAGLVRARRAAAEARRERATWSSSSRARATPTRPSACARSSTAATRPSRDFLGSLHPEAFEIYRAIANRSIAEPRRDLAVGDGGPLRACLGHGRSRPQHARRLGPAAGGAGEHRSATRCGSARASRRWRSTAPACPFASRARRRQRRGPGADGRRRRAGPPDPGAAPRPCRRRPARRSAASRSARWSCSASSPARRSRCPGTTSTRS